MLGICLCWICNPPLSSKPRANQP